MNKPDAIVHKIYIMFNYFLNLVGTKNEILKITEIVI